MKTRYRDPFVKVIKMFDCRKEAWNISRPYLNPGDIKLDDLEKMDLAVSAACVYEFHVQSSILFRDLLFSLRPITPPWARSNRTIPFNTDNLFASSEYKEVDSFIQYNMDRVYDLLAKGHPQDFVKDHLPMGMQTEFTIAMDDRQLVVFLKTLKLANKSLYDIYGKLFLEAIGKDDSYVERRNSKPILDNLQLSFTDMKNINKPKQELGDYYYLVRSMSMSLMAQFIRIHYSNIHNSLWNFIQQPFWERLLCSDDVTVAIYISKQAYDKILGVRSCWFAKMDHEDKSSWSRIIGPDIESMSLPEFVKHLPCRGNCLKCGIKKDMDERINCVEVNLPCPILLSCPELLKARIEKYTSVSRVIDKWQLLNIRKDETNKDYQRYVENLKKVDSSKSREWDIPKKYLL